MRQVLRGLAIVLLAFPAAPVGAQQGSIQVSASAQAVSGDPARTGEQADFEPDFGIAWRQPGRRFGAFHLEMRGTARGSRPHTGRTSFTVRDVTYRGANWTFEGGDTYLMPAIGDYRFANLFTPAVTFTGGAASVRTGNTNLAFAAGRSTALRNIFGTDPDALGQALVTARAMHRVSPRLDVQARASHVRTHDLKEFTYAIASSRQAGLGATLSITPGIQLVADGGVVSYRRDGRADTSTDASFLAGTNWLLSRGWLQINAWRFSPGEFPVLNYQLHDREGVFAAGEYDVVRRLRVFGGLDSFRSNLEPAEAAASARPVAGTNGSRRFGGFRFELWPRSMVMLRIEDGDRIARPIRPEFGAPGDTDTGSWSVEWQTILGSATSFTRYSRRENVDRVNAGSSFTLQDASAQVFLTVSRSVHVFGIAAVMQTGMRQGGGNTYWQAGGGAQVQVPRHSLWLRAEGTLSRNVDLLTDRFVPRESLNVGVNGQVGRQTTIGLNVQVDHAPLPSIGGNPWLTRSTLRVTHTIATGSAAVAGLPAGAPGRSRGTGSIVGVVFADWNGNAIQDAGENEVQGIPVRIPGLTTVTTAANGQFSFLNVPAGAQDVGLDTTALPLDFDPPADASVQLDLARGATERVTFGLIPLGAIAGRVIRDANANGVADPGEEPIDGAIVVLDNGQRSEQARRGRFRFDAVRSGDHTVQLLLDSIGEGAKATTPASLAAPLTREKTTAEVTFLVTIEKRPEIRRVFPSKSGAASPSSPAPTRAAPAATTPAAARRNAPSRIAPHASAAPRPPARFVVQVAALRDGARARDLAANLKASGYPAYVVGPSGSRSREPFRIRVGPYETAAEAARVKARLEEARGERVWVTQDAERASATGR